MRQYRQQPQLGSGFVRLEDRTVPTAFGIPWADPSRLTLSFAPDGTITPTGGSSLATTMQYASGWQREVLRAYQTWAVNGDLNIALVADGGQALGSPGAVQGDARFGDVRVAATGGGATALASASPFNWNGSTYNGDLVFNSRQAFTVGQSSTKYDVFSVAVHEAGHSLGLDHSTAAGSVMNEAYSYRTGLGASDVAAFQALYGTRTPDAADAAGGNDTLATATPLTQLEDGNVQVQGVNGQYLGSGDLSSLGDVDFYKFTTPKAGITGFTVRVRAKGVSLLLPTLTVYDSAGKQVAFSSSTDPTNNDVVVTVTNPKLGATYTLKVDNATADVFGVGRYQVYADVIGAGYNPPSVPPPPAPVRDGHKNDVIGSATDLKPKKDVPADPRFGYTYQGVIEDGLDTDYYKVTSGKPAGTAPYTMNVLAWATDAGGLTPRVRVYDANKQPVAFQVLTNDAGLMSVVVPNAIKSSTYYVQVSARTAGDTGGYVLGVDFNQDVVTTSAGIAGGSLSPTASTAIGSLTVNSGGVYQFGLASSVATAAGGVVTLTVTDASGNTVLTLASTVGQPMTTETRYLAAGAYSLTYKYTPLAGTTAGGLKFDLFLSQLTEELGPAQTTVGSTSPPPPPPPPYTYGGTSSTSTSRPYYL